MCITPVQLLQVLWWLQDDMPVVVIELHQVMWYQLRVSCVHHMWKQVTLHCHHPTSAMLATTPRHPGRKPPREKSRRWAGADRISCSAAPCIGAYEPATYSLFAPASGGQTAARTAHLGAVYPEEVPVLVL